MNNKRNDERLRRELLVAARNVLENWERGDLAGAIRRLNHVVNEVEGSRQARRASKRSKEAGEQSEFRVSWEIDIQATDPVAAAKEALQIIRDAETTATVFNVTGKDGQQLTVDLQQFDEMPSMSR